MQTRATQPLVDRGMNFGVRFAFDSGSDWGEVQSPKFGKVILKLRDLYKHDLSMTHWDLTNKNLGIDVKSCLWG